MLPVPPEMVWPPLPPKTVEAPPVLTTECPPPREMRLVLEPMELMPEVIVSLPPPPSIVSD